MRAYRQCYYVGCGVCILTRCIDGLKLMRNIVLRDCSCLAASSLARDIFCKGGHMVRKKQSRRPGEGTVFQRKDGRWVCEITLEDHSRKQYYFKTEKEALEKRRVVQNELAQGILATGPQQTVKQFLEYW